MRLLLVELTRFRARRAIVLTILGAALLTAVVAGSVIYESRPVSAADQARAEKQVQQELDSPGFQREIDRCERKPERYLGPGSGAADCRDALEPQVDWYLDRSPLELGQVNDDAGTAVLLLVLGLGVIVGTTFAGADWASGSVSNQLLFEPRRIRVWLAKAVAVVLGVVVASAVLLAGFWAALALTAQARDLTVPGEVWRDVWQTAGRGVALAGGVALGSYALTMLFRHTVGTLGVLIAYVVAGEAITGALPFQKMSQWALSNNVLAWLGSGVEVYDDSLCDPSLGGSGYDESCDPTYILGFGHAATYLGVLLAVAVVLSLISFRRRDVP